MQAVAKARTGGGSFWSVQGGGDSGGKGGDTGSEEVEGFEEVKSKKKGRKIRSEDGSFAFDGVPDPVLRVPRVLCGVRPHGTTRDARTGAWGVGVARG